MKFLLLRKKRILCGIIALALLIGSLAAVGATGAYAVAVGKTTRKLPIYCVDTPDKKVAMSFDASWGADKTLSILETLERYGVKANFLQWVSGLKSTRKR